MLNLLFESPYTHAHTNTHTHSYTHTRHAFTHTHTPLHTHACTHTRVYTHTHTNTHTHARARTHTHTHTHTHSRKKKTHITLNAVVRNYNASASSGMCVMIRLAAVDLTVPIRSFHAHVIFSIWLWILSRLRFIVRTPSLNQEIHHFQKRNLGLIHSFMMWIYR